MLDESALSSPPKPFMILSYHLARQICGVVKADPIRVGVIWRIIYSTPTCKFATASIGDHPSLRRGWPLRLEKSHRPQGFSTDVLPKPDKLISYRHLIGLKEGGRKTSPRIV